MELSEIVYKYIGPCTVPFIILLNVFELVSIRKSSKKYIFNPYNVFMNNLSISDLIVGISLLLLHVCKAIQIKLFKDNIAMNIISDFFIHCSLRISLCSSVFFLSAVTISRLRIVTKPFSTRKISRISAHKISVGLWFVSIVIVIPEFILYTVSRKFNTRYRRLLYPIMTYPATVLFCYCYHAIHTKLLKNEKRMANYKRRSRRNHMQMDQSSLDGSIPMYDKNQEAVGISMVSIDVLQKPRGRNGFLNMLNFPVIRSSGLREKCRFAKIAISTVVGFVICWIPHSTFVIIQASGIIDRWKYVIDVKACLDVLLCWNSILNPIIYLLYNRKCIKKSKFRSKTFGLQEVSSSTWNGQSQKGNRTNIRKDTTQNMFCFSLH